MLIKWRNNRWKISTINLWIDHETRQPHTPAVWRCMMKTTTKAVNRKSMCYWTDKYTNATELIIIIKTNNWLFCCTLSVHTLGVITPTDIILLVNIANNAQNCHLCQHGRTNWSAILQKMQENFKQRSGSFDFLITLTLVIFYDDNEQYYITATYFTQNHMHALYNTKHDTAEA